MANQLNFFESNEQALKLLNGFRYTSALIDAADEDSLLVRVSELPFEEFDFHGYKGKRRVVSYGWHYDFSGRELRKAEDIPEFLLALRVRVAEFAGFEPGAFQHVLVIEFGPGAGIGWHRDKAVFGELVGVSLLAPCVLRFRRKVGEKLSAAGKRVKQFERVSVFAEPRSAYHLSGLARSEWEHSILRVDSPRYAITFRNVLD